MNARANVELEWSAVAMAFGERVARPLALVDDSGVVCFANDAFSRLVGLGRSELEGRSWTCLCPAATRGRRSGAGWFDRALRGAIRTYEANAITSAGDLIALRLELSLVGRGSAQGLVVEVLRSTPLSRSPAAAGVRDADYEIETHPDFGALSRLTVDGELVPTSGDRCYRLLHGADHPCDECPVRSTGEWPKTVVRPREIDATSSGGDLFEVTTASKVDGGKVRIRLRTLSRSAVDLVQEARVERAAARANLSSRQREVLRYLLLGRSIDEIASIMGIAARTVKYHQASLLQKLGADSRVDLVRVLF